MTAVLAGVAAVLAAVGVVAAIVNVGVFALARPRMQESDDKPDLVPWGYVGGGLALGFVAYWLARGVGTGSWRFADDVAALAIMLGVASWGFGAMLEWAERRQVREVPWTAPLVAAICLGAAAGAAGLS